MRAAGLRLRSRSEGGGSRAVMTEDAIVVRFNALGRDVVGEKNCDYLRELIMAIKNEAALGRLFDLMTKHFN